MKGLFSRNHAAASHPNQSELCDNIFGQQFCRQVVFLRMLCLERQRTERSRRPFGLMLLRFGTLARIDLGTLQQIVSVLARSTREIDTKGWYEDPCVVGVLFTELDGASLESVGDVLSTRIRRALDTVFNWRQSADLQISFHIFPEDRDGRLHCAPKDCTLYPDLQKQMVECKLSHVVKRTLDVTISLVALALLTPVFLAIGVAVKLNSKGPLLFRQERLGQHGKPFTFLKFRSMYVSTDHRCHEDYVKQFISGEACSYPGEKECSPVYKLTQDVRVTSVGKFLRRTSMDELPQLINVLRGEMSLVGPRPPIRYEFDAYQTWHKRRLVEAQPGITGLWQVTARSKTKFDEMVRLDLQYARSRSFWLDIWILLKTPRAVLFGGGAY